MATVNVFPLRTDARMLFRLHERGMRLFIPLDAWSHSHTIRPMVPLRRVSSKYS
jgi:hypothetical protein